MNALIHNQDEDAEVGLVDPDHGEEPAKGESGFVVASSTGGMNRGSVAMFLLLAAGVGAMYLMYVRGGPGKANASMTAQTQAADATIHGFLNSNDANQATLERSLRNTEKIVQQFLNYPGARQVPLKQLAGNPFREVSADAPDADSEATKRLREQKQGDLLKEAQALRLQSIIHSDSARACLIDNTLYREGQVVGGFIIERINSDGVIVKSGMYRFELRMQR